MQWSGTNTIAPHIPPSQVKNSGAATESTPIRNIPLQCATTRQRSGRSGGALVLGKISVSERHGNADLDYSREWAY